MGDPSPLLCAGLCLVGAALLATPSLRSRRGLLLSWALLCLGLTLLPPLSRLARSGEVREYTFAHYHLGARYFGELGYTGLYEQTLAASGHAIESQRDLTTYAHVSPRGERSPAWTDARWSALQADLAVLEPRQDSRSWASWFKDKGYNATPAWTATFGRLVGARPASGGWFAFLGALDVLMLGLAFGAAGRVFGWRSSLVAAAWVSVFYGSAQNLVGGPLQMDWLAAMVLAACAMQSGKQATAGAFFGWAVASRVFPALLLVGPALALGRSRHLRGRALRFGAGVGTAVLAALLVGSSTGRGAGAWIEFGEKIQTHAEHHHLGDRRIGWRPMAAWSPVGEQSDAAARAERATDWGDRAGWATGIAVTLSLAWGVLLLTGARRTPSGDGGRELLVLLLMSLPVPFLLLTMSRYYALLPALGLLLLGPYPTGRPALYGAALFGLTGVVWLAVALGIPDATTYCIANGLWLTLACAVTVGWSASPRGGLSRA
ncbi:MAG: hypothetical protein KDA24_05795 [Deltaproteobacteria bacterium]|nr:hypothetical protein [Deltaproteobacteria bacterium]